jgi:hypothetical protein
MRKRTKDFDFLQMVADSDPGMAEIVQEIRRDYATGRLRHQPWRWDQCHSWLDAWLYIYRRVCLDYEAHLMWEDDRVRCAVQIGPDFNDKTVDLLERLADRLGAGLDLQELRLIGTRVTDRGLQRLERLFPNARIARYSWEDCDTHPEISYAKKG